MATLSVSATDVARSALARDANAAKDRVILITGASSGVGLVSARVLAKAGATVVLAVRDVSKGERVVASFGDVAPGRCDVMRLDLASLASVRAFASAFAARADGGRLDVLMANAGLAVGKFTRTEDGLEETFQVHVVAHHLLVRLLTPQLERTAAQTGDARVIWVSSVGHMLAKGMKWASGDVDPGKADAAPRAIGFYNDSPDEIRNALDGFSAYTQAKLCQLVLARRLYDELLPKKILVATLHPGGVATNIWPWWIQPLMGLVMASPERGAATQVHLALAPRADVVRVDEAGRPRFEYWAPRAMSTPARAKYRRSVVEDPDTVERFVALVEALLRERGFAW